MGTPIKKNDEPKNITWNDFVTGICSQLSPGELHLPKDKVKVIKPFLTSLRNESAAFGTSPFLASMVIKPREEGLVENTGRSRHFTTKLPPYSPDIVAKIQETTMSDETISPPPQPSYFFEAGLAAPRLSTYIHKNDLPQYRAHSQHLHSFKTFLKEYGSFYIKVQREPSFLVVTPNQLLAYPTILPLFRNYGLQLVEPHYTFTAYLHQCIKPIYFFKRNKTYRYSSDSYYMRPKFYGNVMTSIVNDQSKLSHGYIMSGLSYVFNYSHETAYNILRSILSNHHRPDYIIYVLIPEDVMNEIPATLAFDPTTNYTILMYNYEYFKQTVADKYFEGRILPEDHVPKSAPFCFTTENGNVNYVLLLEWKTVTPKTIMVFHAINMILDEGADSFEQAGMAPDYIILFTPDEYDVDYDWGNYLYERIYVNFFTKTFPAKTFSVVYQPVELDDILEWFKHEPIVPYFECKYDRLPAVTERELKQEKAESGGEWILQISWGDDSKELENTYYGIRQAYYMKHIESPVPSVEQLSKATDSGITAIEEKLNLKDVEGRVEYFQNVKKLPLFMRDSPDTKEWGRICHVTTLDEAMVVRGHYNYNLRYGEVTYLMKSKLAAYKFLNNQMYHRLSWAWWTTAHVLVAGQPFCGARYVCTALGLILKAPHIYYDAIYKSALAIKRMYNHCYYLESCWMGIWFYKWGIYTAIEAKRFKHFLPWAVRRVKNVRALVCKGMDEPTVNEMIDFHCYYPYRRLSSGQRLNIFPQLKFAYPYLEPKYIRWDDGILEGYVRILDLIMLYVLNMECPPLFLARLIYDAPDHLLPEMFQIEHPREMFLCANIFHEIFHRQKEPPRALEESRILSQAIFQAMAKQGNIPGQGWVVSGIKVYPKFIKRLSEMGVQEKIVYITDPTFHLFKIVQAGKTFKQTSSLAKELSYITRYIKPMVLKKYRRELVKNLKLQVHMFAGYRKCSRGEHCDCIRTWMNKTPENTVPAKCICKDYVATYTRFSVCKNIALPTAMHDKNLTKPDFSPIWEMVKNVASFPDRDTMCFNSHPNLNYNDHVPFVWVAMKPLTWKHTYCRRYVFDYFFEKSYKEKHPFVDLKMKQIRPRKFNEMVTEIVEDNVVEPLNCTCRMLCLCAPITIEEYAKFN